MVGIAVITFSSVLLYLTGTTPQLTGPAQPPTHTAQNSPIPSASATPTTTASPSPAASTPPTTPATKPKTKATANTSTGTSTGTNRFGLSVGNTLPGLPATELAKQLDDFKALGVGWIRLDFDWNDIQPNGPSSYDWSRHDAIAAAANARNIQLLPILTYTPPWARASACPSDFRCSPANPAQFGNLAYEAAKHFAPKGVHYWEIWNEQNTNGAWASGPNANAYVQLLKAAYPLIKQADGASVVISGGLASSDQSDGIPQLDYLSAMYAAGGKPYFDAVGYHPYSYPVPASYNISWNAWTKMSLTSPSIRSIMTANGDAGKKVWVTEYGAPTDGPGPVATSANGYNISGGPDHVDEALQALIITDVFRTAKAYSWLGPLFWYSYKDEGAATTSTENFFGLIRANGSQKPGYSALKQATAN